MWFAKWFGGRSNREDDEPARFAPAAPKPVSSARRVQSNVVGSPAGAGTKQDKRGFDPYNSGSFDRNQGWGRIITRR